MKTQTVPAYAKLNLTLDILGKRDDGYHELRMVMQTVSLCDDVTVTLTEQGETERARCRAEFDRRGAEFLRELGDEDAREALRILKRCNEILSKQDPTETKGGDTDENHQAL